MQEATGTQAVLTRVATYIAAGSGPLGGMVISPMLPNIAHSLGSNTSAAAMALTADFVPFASLQLFSGTLGERWGRRRTVRTAFYHLFSGRARMCHCA